MKFGCVFAVKDIRKARAFYEELFAIRVTEDFGRNISFDCGLSLQEDFDWLVGIDKSEMKRKENNCELYFETEDLDDFAKRLKDRGDACLLHDVKMMPWLQRCMRFYDPDGHLIEVGEPMKPVVERLQAEGLTLSEVAKRMDVTVEDVCRMLEA